MKRVFWVLLCLLIAQPAFAQGRGAGAVRKQIEASMLLTGSIVVDEQGKVAKFEIDRAQKVAKPLVDFVNANAMAWQFEPTMEDGKPASVRNKWSLRLIAKKNPEDAKKMSVRISGVSFDPYTSIEGTDIAVSPKGLSPPNYPMKAGEAGVGGMVYLIVKVGKDGSVDDVITEQVNLRVVASEPDMRKWRNLLSTAAMTKAKQWVFVPPTKGDWTEEPFWLARVPVDFNFADRETAYGQWEAYVPGPRQTNPWRESPDAPGFSPDAMVAGGAQMVGREGGLKLLTPLDG